MGKTTWNDEKLHRCHDKILNELKKSSFKYTDEEYKSYFLDYISHQTKSLRVMRLVTLAWYLGRLRQICALDDGKSKVTLS